MKSFSLLWFISLSALLGLSAHAQTSGYEISALAGQPFFGSADGPGRAAGFTFPKGMAVDPSGNLIVADTSNHTIRKVTRAGVVTTLAGQAGVAGSVNGIGTAARFNYPYGVAIDAAGNIYVGDSQNHTVRRITPAGVVSTLAGAAGATGSADGIGGDARFNYPTGVAVDRAGNIYVADLQNHLIREISPAGNVTTLAGTPADSGSADGVGSEARFSLPIDVTVDGGGNVYVADLGYDAIRKITPQRVVTTIAGLAGHSGSDDGVGSVARFSFPVGVTADNDGNVFVADSFNHTIRRIAPNGLVTTVAGTAGGSGAIDGVGKFARFDTPADMAIDSTGNVFVTDSFNGSIRQIARSGAVTTLAGGGSAGGDDGVGETARFRNPSGVAVDLARNVYVADTFNNVVRKITPAGVVTTFAGTTGQFGSEDGPGDVARFNFTLGVAVDRDGNVYVTDSSATVRKITPVGAVTTLAGLAGHFGEADGTGSAARFSVLNGLAVDATGNVFVADQENSTIRKITPAGVVTTLAGAAGQRGDADGIGRAARFVQPAGVVLDSAGNVYVSDRGNFTIRKITPAGEVTTFAGQPGISGSLDGTGRAARFVSATGIAIDRAGRLYVADGNNTIRQITPSGVVTTLVTKFGHFDELTGGARLQKGYFTTSVATDVAGNLYLADAGNNTIRKAVSTTRLTNLSIRSHVGTGDETLIMGFAVSSGGPKPLLLRAVGPTLASLGVTGAVADPQLSFFAGAGNQILENDNWGGSDSLVRAFASVGAFALPARSLDAALFTAQPAGKYSAQVTAANPAGGVVLLETYDADAGAPSRLVNVSARAVAGSADATLIAGFILEGRAPKTLLIRGVGPSLIRLGLGAARVLSDPKVTLYRGETSVAENDDWRGAAEVKVVAKTVGAFDLDSDASKDGAFLATLDPGVYTVHVTGANTSSSGVALVEIYEVP